MCNMYTKFDYFSISYQYLAKILSSTIFLLILDFQVLKIKYLFFIIKIVYKFTF